MTKYDSIFDTIQNNSYQTTKKKKKNYDEQFGDIQNNSYELIAPINSNQEPENAIDKIKGINPKDIINTSQFDDGYQFGDITKTIIGTGADIYQDLSKGAISNLEGIADALTNYASIGVEKAGKKDWAENMRKFAQKNIGEESGLYDRLSTYNTLGVTNTILNGNIESLNPFNREAIKKNVESFENTSLFGEKTDEITQGVGQLVGQAALNSVGVPWQLTAFLNSAGNEMNNAFQNGADYQQALISSTISGLGEVGSEYLGGGANKLLGMSSVGEKVFEKLGSKITNKVISRLTKLGFDMASEGAEEVVSGYIQALGQQMTYMSDKEINEIYSSEQALEDFIGGALVSGVANVPGNVRGVARGENAWTNRTENEQKVYDAVLEERIAEQEKDGKKLTQKQINAIEEQLEKDMAKGRISVSQIEDALGFGDRVNNLVHDNEIKLGRKLNQQEINDIRDELSEQYFKDISKDTILQNSYYENSQKSKGFDFDAKKYKGKQLEILQKAKDSGILNNTGATHEFVDFISKIGADKNLNFDFTNNEKLKNSSFAVNGADVNGFVTNDGITLNINSAKSLNSVVGHEITHVLEGSDLYQALSDSLKEYAETKGEYAKRYNELQELYKNVEGADITKELNADLVGDYLFTNQEFINHLTQNRNLFQRIYDEIKYLVKQATAGSKEQKQLLKAQKMFEQAYRDNSVKLAEQNKYSLTTDSNGRELSKEQQDYFKDSKVRDENGNLKVMYHGSSNDFTIFDRTKAKGSGLYGRGLYFAYDKGTSDLYEKGGKTYEVYINSVNPLERGQNNITREQFRNLLEYINSDANEDIDLYNYGTDNIDEILDMVYTGDDFRDLQDISATATGDFVETLEMFNQVNGTNYDGIAAGDQFIAFYPEQIKNVDNTNPTDNEDIRYSLSSTGEMVDNATGEKVELDASDTGNTGTLMAIHNLSEDKLNGVLDLGGFPVPSIAVTNDYTSNQQFGNISVLFDKNTINPEIEANKVYSRDAYTTRIPSVVNALNPEGLEQVSKNTGMETWDLKSRYEEKPMQDAIDDMKKRIEIIDKYLDEKGITVEPVYREFKGYGGLTSDYFNDFIKNNPDFMDLNITDKESFDTYEKYYPAIHELYVQNAIDKGNGNITRDVAEGVLDGFPHYSQYQWFLNSLEESQKVSEGGKEIDDYATKDAKLEAIGENSKEYNDYVKNLVAPMFGDRYIRNNKDYYTSSGNPRSFNQRYDEYTLDNIVRIMNENKGTGQEGGFFSGINELAADSSIRFNSLEDIKNNENLLQKMDNTELEKIREEYKNRLFDIQQDILEQYGELDTESYIWREKSIGESIKEIARKMADGKKINADKVINSFSKNYININETQANDIINLINDLKTLPTDYFEAKPQRAVGLDEIQQVVIPSNSSQELRDRLQEMGIPFVEYNPEVEGDRNRVINQFDDLKFSMSKQNQDIAPIGDYNIYGKDIELQEEIAPVKEDLSRLNTEIAAIREDYNRQADEIKSQIQELKDLRENLFTDNTVDENYYPVETQNNIEEAPYYQESTVALDDKALKKYKEYFKDSFDIKGRQLTQAMEGIKELSKNPNLTKSDVYNYMKQNFGKEETRVINDEISDAKYELKNTPIGVTDDIKKDIAYTFDTYGKFRKQNFGKLKLVDYNGSNAVDQVYIALNEQFPDLFPEDINNPVDQLLQIHEVANGKDYKSYFRDLPDNEIRAYSDELYGMIQEYRQDTLKSLAEAPLPQEYFDNLAPYEEESEVSIDEELNKLEQKLNGLKNLEGMDILNAKRTFDEITNPEEISQIEKDTANILDLINQEEQRRNGNVKLVEPKISPEKSTLRKGIDTLKTMFINKNAEIDNLAKESGNKNIKFAGDMLNNYSAEAQNDIEIAQTNNEGKEIGKSLRQIFEPVKEKGLETQFNDYLINYSNIDRWNNNKGSKTPIDVSERIVADYEARYPEFRRYAKDVWNYGKNYLNNMHDAGLINDYIYNYLGEKYQHYVPYITDSNTFDATLDSINELKARGIKKAYGGSTEVLPVEEALTRYTYAQKRALRTNELYKEIVNELYTDADKTNPPGQDRLEDYTNLTNSLYRDDAGNNYLTAFINGEEKSVKVSDDLFKSLRNDMDTRIKDVEKRLAIITKPLQTVGKLRRNILTSWSPSFMIKNPVKDIQDALLNSKHTAEMVKNYPSAVKELWSDSTPEVRQFKALYGSGNTMGQFDVESGLYNPKIGNKNNNFLKILPRVNETMELAPRYAEFKASLQAGESYQEAMYNAREITTNFSRGGVITKALNRNGFTFLNANVQGFDKFIRNFSGENGAKGIVNSLVKAAIFGVSPAIFNELAFGTGDDKDEDYDALPDYIKDNYYLIKTGNGKFIRIPKGRMLSVFGSAARRTIEAAEGEENAFEGFLENANNQVGISNPEENNIFAPLIQALGSENGTAWYGGDIVPSRLQDKPKNEQYDASTDKFSIWLSNTALGKKLGLSPYKVNYIIDQYSGGVGDLALPYITDEAESEGGLLAPIKDQFTADSTTDNKYVSDFYSKNDELKVKANSSEATDLDKVKNQYMYSVSSEMAKLYAERRAVQSNNSLTKAEKYKKSQAIKDEINKLAKEGLDNYGNTKITGNYASAGDEEFYKNAKGKWTTIDADTKEEINSLGLTNVEKNSYFNAKNDIYNTTQEYKTKLENASETEKATLNANKKKSIINTIKSSGLTDDAKANLYDKSYASTDTLNAILNCNIDFDSYLDLQAQSFTADKDSDGKSINGSKKAKVYNYINQLNIPYEKKIMLAKLEYKSDDTYNNEIIGYLNNDPTIDYQDMKSILKAMGMKVDEYGNITW